ncbi:MAG: hypothetical protein HKM89_08005 [Gemmatimonadales bacterium]|nr:hypothetical protein [Gemmatimonadales bacterium]
MKEHTPTHLSLEEVDAWLDGSLPETRQTHIESCFECRTLTRAERVLVRRLEAVERLAPSPAFAEGVMARLDLPDPFALRTAYRFWDRVKASRRTLAIAASIMVVLGLSMGGSVAWSLSHPETLSSWGSWLTAQASSWFWVGLRGAVSNLLEHPWYDTLKHLVGTPGRIAAFSAINMAVYVGCVLLMKRLLAFPGQRVIHARS